jgi:hypothetical protein
MDSVDALRCYRLKIVSVFGVLLKDQLGLCADLAAEAFFRRKHG